MPWSALACSVEYAMDDSVGLLYGLIEMVRWEIGGCSIACLTTRDALDPVSIRVEFDEGCVAGAGGLIMWRVCTELYLWSITQGIVQIWF